MKKLNACIFLLTILLVFSCSNDDDGSSYVEENFLAGYLESTGFDEGNSDYIDSGYYEFGLEFIPLVAGKITKLKVELPDVNNALRITIWDKVAGTIFRTEVVDVSSENTEFIFDISDIELVKGKEYAISMNSNDWTERFKTYKTAVTYPFTVGNININSYVWDYGTEQVYPASASISHYGGDLSFDFIQTE